MQRSLRFSSIDFGSRIHLEIEQDEEDWDDILHCMIPKLTLQPILENSIIHGIELKLDEGKVTISISRTKSRLLIKVSDDGVGMNRETLDKLNAKLGSKEEEVKKLYAAGKRRRGTCQCKQSYSSYFWRGIWNACIFA